MLSSTGVRRNGVGARLYLSTTREGLCPSSPHRVYVHSALTPLFRILIGFKWMTNYWNIWGDYPARSDVLLSVNRHCHATRRSTAKKKALFYRIEQPEYVSLVSICGVLGCNTAAQTCVVNGTPRDYATVVNRYTSRMCSATPPSRRSMGHFVERDTTHDTRGL